MSEILTGRVAVITAFSIICLTNILVNSNNSNVLNLYKIKKIF